MMPAATTQNPLDFGGPQHYLRGRAAVPSHQAAGTPRAINSVGECHLHTVEVTGSNPVSPTPRPRSALRSGVFGF